MLTTLLVLALGHTLVDFYATSVTPLLPHFQQLWGISSTSLGSLAAATSVTGSLLQPLLGFYLDRKGTSLLLAVSLVWLAVTVVALGWVPSFAALFATATVASLGSAVYHPLGAALARRVSPPAHRGLYMSLFMNVGNLGWALAPVSVTWCVSALSLRALGWLAIPGVLAALALSGLGLSLTGLATGRRGNGPVPEAPAPGSPAPASRRTRHRGVFFLVAATIVRSWVASGIQVYLPLYLVQQGHSLAFAGRVMTAFILAGTLAGVAVGYLSDRLGHRTLYAGSLLLAAAALAWFLQAPSSWAGPAAALTGAALLGTLPLTVVMVQEMLPNRTGTGSGLVMGFSGGTGGLLVLASGVLADRLGLGAALGWLIPALPLGALLALAIPEAACRRPEPLSRPAATAVEP